MIGGETDGGTTSFKRHFFLFSFLMYHTKSLLLDRLKRCAGGLDPTAKEEGR